MARDHRRLRVYHEAHALALAIYNEPRPFPRDEWFGIRSAVSSRGCLGCQQHR